ncbi:MAG: 3-deoxy-8-phosphooctulonate synthase [Deltaproteobacteria bacterium]|jgi:2-dehydro-3-deoxyphosphooctonate aldolase (KDO 8-P synthase)|nr:3-deoxy-8-phosphooctulonate synthase [Deltaproteobacteria bacterium]MDH4008531.1 3-deoxy-8-phosphooctulonate synthase [Desulfuromonadales bacterium]
MMRSLALGSFSIGGDNPLVLIAGPCVLENQAHALSLAEALQDIALRVGVGLVFKASYDKANRTSVTSYRGPGLDKGLQILQIVKEKTGLPILSDIHDVSQVKPAAAVLDILQIPAFLSRQTDLLVAAGESGKVVNIKKGQFQAPWDIENAIGKVLSTGNDQILLTERGSSFGYNNLVSDMRSLVIMRQTGYPVVFDATHSVQLPGGAGSASSGQREFVAPLSRAAVATGVDALFWEVHENPAKALCDGPNSLQLDSVEGLLRQMLALDKIVR